jgi:hypothetical protein
MFPPGRRITVAVCSASLTAILLAGCAPFEQVGLQSHPREVAQKVNIQNSRNGFATVAYGPWLVMESDGSAFPTSTLTEPIHHPIHACTVFVSLSASILNGYPEGSTLDVVLQSEKWYPLERAYDVSGTEFACDPNSPREREVSGATQSVRIDLPPSYITERLSSGMMLYISSGSPGGGIVYVFVPPAYLRGFLDAISGAGQSAPIPGK